MKCPFCDAIVPAGNAVCSFCGEAIPGAQPSKEVPGTVAEELGAASSNTEQIIDYSEQHDAPIITTTEIQVFPGKSNQCVDFPDSILKDDSKETLPALAIDVPEEVVRKVDVPENISTVGVSESDIQTSTTKKEAAPSSKRPAASKPKALAIMAVLLFLCGVTIGGLFFGNRPTQEPVLPAASQENSDISNISNHENQTIVTPDPSEVTDKPLDEADTSEQNELEISPNENKTAEKIEEPIDSKVTEEFKEQIAAPDEATTAIIDPNFQGVWGVYLANDDGSIAYDSNGEMLFSGDFIVVDLDHQYIFSIGEDGNLSNKWAIQKTEEISMITFWAENGYFSLAHLVTDNVVREICGTSGADTFSMVWFKVDTAIPSYEELLEDQTTSEAPITAPVPSEPAVESQPVVGDYKDFPGVPDFGILNKVNPYAVLDLEGGSKVYIYLHSDLENAGTYMMIYNLYDQELLKKGFTQSGFSDNGSGSSTAANYGKYENGIATAVIITPLDNYGGEGCMVSA